MDGTAFDREIMQAFAQARTLVESVEHAAVILYRQNLDEPPSAMFVVHRGLEIVGSLAVVPGRGAGLQMKHAYDPAPIEVETGEKFREVLGHWVLALFKTKVGSNRERGGDEAV